MKFSNIFVQNSNTAFEQNVSNYNDINDLTVQVANVGDAEPSSGASTGETIDTSADLGSGLDVTDYDEVQLVFRDASNSIVDVSPPIPVSDLEASWLLYFYPSQQVTNVNFPSSPASDDRWTVKVTDLEKGHQPFPRRSYEVLVESGFTNEQIVEAFVDAINNREDQINNYQGASVLAGVTYGTDAHVALGTPSTGDDFNLTVESTQYTTAVVGGDELQTFYDFYNEHADTILQNHGVDIRVDVGGNSDLFIYQAEGYGLDLSFGNDIDASITGGNGTSIASTTDASGTEELRLQGENVGDIFDVATRNFEEDSITTQFTPNDGVGTYEQVSSYEEKDRGTSGRYVQSTNVLGSLPAPPSYANQNGRYDLFTFQFPGDSDKGVNKTIDRQHYIVALEQAVMNNASTSNGTSGVEDFTEFFNPVIISQ